MCVYVIYVITFHSFAIICWFYGKAVYIQHHATCHAIVTGQLQERIRLAEEAGTIKVGRAWIPSFGWLVGWLGEFQLVN